MAKDLKLFKVPNSNNQDLFIGGADNNFDLVLINDIDAIRQNLSIRLRFFFGEWFLENSKGIKFFDFIFVKNPDLNFISSIIKTFILETNKVNELTEYSQEFNTKTRQLSINFIVNTTEGIISLEETIGV